MMIVTGIAINTDRERESERTPYFMHEVRSFSSTYEPTIFITVSPLECLRAELSTSDCRKSDLSIVSDNPYQLCVSCCEAFTQWVRRVRTTATEEERNAERGSKQKAARVGHQRGKQTEGHCREQRARLEQRKGDSGEQRADKSREQTVEEMKSRKQRAEKRGKDHLQ